MWERRRPAKCTSNAERLSGAWTIPGMYSPVKCLELFRFCCVWSVFGSDVAKRTGSSGGNSVAREAALRRVEHDALSILTSSGQRRSRAASA